MRGENSHFSLNCEKETENKKRTTTLTHWNNNFETRNFFFPVDGISRFFGKIKKQSQIIKKKYLNFEKAKKKIRQTARRFEPQKFLVSKLMFQCVIVVVLFLFSSLSRNSEKSENSHHAKIVNYNVFSEFLQMVPKHNFIGPFKLFFVYWVEPLN